jgi:uncharacterized protein with FMN-binding domain
MAVVALKKAEVPEVAFRAAPDGTYRGEIRYGLYTTALDAAVKGGRLEGITLVEHPSNGWADEARAVTDRIVEAQSLDVEAVTGATCTSNAIRMAVERAFQEGS